RELSPPDHAEQGAYRQGAAVSHLLADQQALGLRFSHLAPPFSCAAWAAGRTAAAASSVPPGGGPAPPPAAGGACWPRAGRPSAGAPPPSPGRSPPAGGRRQGHAPRAASFLRRDFLCPSPVRPFLRSSSAQGPQTADSSTSVALMTPRAA